MFNSYDNNDDFLNISINYQGFPVEDNPFNLDIPDNLLSKERNSYSLGNSLLPSLHQEQFVPILNPNQELEERNNIALEINNQLWKKSF